MGATELRVPCDEMASCLQWKPHRRQQLLILVAAHVSFLLWEGLCKSLGIMVLAIAEDYDTDIWPVGCTVGSMIAARGLSGFLLKVLETRSPFHCIASVAGLVAGIGVIGASWTANVTQLACFLILLTGLSFGFVLNISIVLLGQHFSQFHACANGVVFAGGPVGILLFTPLTQLLVDTYGWHGALMLIGGSTLHLGAVGRLMRQLPSSDVNYTAVRSDRHGDGGGPSLSPPPTNQQCHPWRSARELPAKLVRVYDLNLFTNLSYITLLCCLGNLCLVNSTWIIYSVPHLLAKGLSTNDSTLIVSVGGFGILVGHICHGLLVDFKLVKGRTMMYVSNVIMGLTLVGDPLLDGKLPLAANNFLFGVGLGMALPLTYTLMREVVGVDRMTNAVGWAEAVGSVCRIAASTGTGLTFDMIGSYDIPYFVIGSCTWAVILLFITEDILHKRLR